MNHDAVGVGRELEPLAREFAQAVGLLDPVREVVGGLTDRLYYRREARRAELLAAVAEKVKKTGVPPRAVPDSLLRAVLEDGADAESDELRGAWANLLANAATTDRQPHPLYVDFLRQITPEEARFLDQMPLGYRGLEARGHGNNYYRGDGSRGKVAELSEVGLENLVRLGIVNRATESDEITVTPTVIGRGFLLAVTREPGETD